MSESNGGPIQVGGQELSECVCESLSELFSVFLGVAYTVPRALDLNGADGSVIFRAVRGDNVGAAVVGGTWRGLGADGAWETALSSDFE